MLDYGRSILAIPASILKHHGCAHRHASLPLLDDALAAGYKNAVVMLFDGLGLSLLERHLPADAFLRRHVRGRLTSVFPSTTTAATVTMESGLSPIEHGWLGWHLFFEEIGFDVSIFPNTISGTDGKPAAEYNVAQRYLPYTNVCEALNAQAAGRVFAERVSPFSRYRSQSVESICETVRSLCGKGGNRYIYTYWHEPDASVHNLGTEDPQITAIIRHINDTVEAMHAGLADTLLVVTADHGLVDVEWRYLRDCPDMTALLARAPSVEARAIAFAVQAGRHAAFERIFQQHFGADYTLLPTEQALAAGLFGPGKAHPRARGFLGDYVAIATGRVSIELYPSVNPMRAAHAGMTQEELTVPLIMVPAGGMR